VGCMSGGESASAAAVDVVGGCEAIPAAGGGAVEGMRGCEAISVAAVEGLTCCGGPLARVRPPVPLELRTTKGGGERSDLTGRCGVLEWGWGRCSRAMDV